jgi:uncharacterized membrane protein
MSPNVHRIERVAAGAAAAWLATAAMRRPTQAPDSLTRVAPWLAGLLFFRALTGYCPVYGALGTGTRRMDTKRALAGPRGLHVREHITVERRPHEVFAMWRRLENLPRYMPHLESVQELDERRSHWVTKPVAGMRYEWDAEIVNEVEGEHIGWRSLPGADVVSAGSVHFTPAPGGRGTDVQVTLQYDPPAGKLGGAIARLLGEDPAAQIREDLRRFKRWMETGAFPTDDREPLTADPLDAVTDFDRRVSVQPHQL